MEDNLNKTKMSLEQALEMFPEIRSDFPEILKMLRKEELELAEKLKNFRKVCLSMAETYWNDGKYQDSMRVEGYYTTSPGHKRLKDLSLYIRRLEDIVSGRKTTLSDADIERARETPMAQVLGSNRKFWRCFFHNEKTASFHVTGNKWYCHGCAEGGNTIGFIMKKYNLSFRQAVEAINSYQV